MKRIAWIALALLLALTLSGCQRQVEEEEPVPNPIATITMQDGSVMRFELRPDCAPNTVANFVKLANSGFYDGLQFFRVVVGAFIQGGDPLNNGTGDPGYAIKGEFAANGVQNTLSHSRGVISMARQSGYDTAGSQFFILQGNFPADYDGLYAAFGTALDEATIGVIDTIAGQPADTSYRPITRQIIATIRVETFDVEYEPVTLDRVKK